MYRKNEAAAENAWLKREVDAWQRVQKKQKKQKIEKKHQHEVPRSSSSPLEKPSDDESCEAEFDWSPETTPTGLQESPKNSHVPKQMPAKPMDKPSATREVKQAMQTLGGNTSSVSFHTYCCPVAGCKKKFYFDPKQSLPLRGDGTITDQTSWLCGGEYGQHKVFLMRVHMKNAHPDVPETKYPPGYSNAAI